MRSIFSYFHLDSITTAFILLLCLFYLFISGFRLKKISFYFFAGIILLFICIDSPLHFIGENYLFSAQMIAHVLLLLVVAPLLVAGIPEQNRLKAVLSGFSENLSRFPWACWFIGVGIMWFWHIPYIFNQLFTMKATPPGTEHIMSTFMYIHLFSLLVAGVIFSWPLMNPYPRHRISSLKAVLYLATACVFCSLLGLLITFAPAGTYTHYISGTDPYGFLLVIRKTWGISAAVDQQIGGLIMWVPCCFIYLSASMYLLIKWFADEKEIASLSDINIL